MLKKIIKIIFIILLTGFVGVYIAFTIYTAPKSDKEVLKLFSESKIKPQLSKQRFKNLAYRKISISKDTTLPTIVFIHGAIGSLTNFSNYLKDSLLQTKANMIAYDRIGYNYKDKNRVQASIASEVALPKDLTKNISKEKLIIIGYSYGGPIALAFKEKVKKIVLFAPALYSKEEVKPWLLNFYKWRLTRWLVPYVWKQASIEKMGHQEDLQKFEDSWQDTPNRVLSFHGTSDLLVPYKNSKLLENAFINGDFKLKTIEGARHNLVWSEYSLIKEQLITILD